MPSSAPILSICIPTHNRAETLRLTLANVLSEAAPFGERVEVVVSDNASTDPTTAVLAGFGPALRWQTRPANVGLFRNVVGLAGEIARGRFLWVMGDDDMIIRGSVARVLRHLEERPDLDFFYLNYSWIPMAERNERILHQDSRAEVPIGSCNFTTADTVDLERLEQLALLPNRNSCGIFCGMFCYLLPRAFYQRLAGSADGQRFDCFSPVLEDIYPHAKTLLDTFLGRPARLVGEPCLLQGVGSWEWKRYEVCYKITPLLQLLDYARTAGMDPAILARMLTDFDRTAGRNFARMALDPRTHLGLETVLAESLPRLRQRPGFWRAFFAGTRDFGQPGWEAAAAPILARLFTPLLRERRPGGLTLWGTGALAGALLAAHPDLAISQVVDPLPANQGQVYAPLGLPVQAPGAAAGPDHLLATLAGTEAALAALPAGPGWAYSLAGRTSCRSVPPDPA